MENLCDCFFSCLWNSTVYRPPTTIRAQVKDVPLNRLPVCIPSSHDISINSWPEFNTIFSTHALLPMVLFTYETLSVPYNFSQRPTKALNLRTVYLCSQEASEMIHCTQSIETRNPIWLVASYTRKQNIKSSPFPPAWKQNFLDTVLACFVDHPDRSFR